MLLGKRIKALRKEKGLTQQQLGDMINVTKVSICCYEKGTRNPSFQTLGDLSRVFGVDLNYFLGIDDYVVAEDKEDYHIPMAQEEIDFILEMRTNTKLHDQLLDDPKRLLQLIDKKIK